MVNTVHSYLLKSVHSILTVTKGIMFLVEGEGEGEAKTQAISAVQSMVLRLLSTVQPGKLKMLIIDPVGLGQNMAPFLPLKDYDETLITSRVWSEPEHIKKKLIEITRHLETVIQGYLQDKYTDIEEYNKQAGEIAEPYHLVIIMDFPVNFCEETTKRLQSIIQNGPRCGVYTIIITDENESMPYGIELEQISGNCEQIDWIDVGWFNRGSDFSLCSVDLDRMPPSELVNQIITTVGEYAKKATKVEVPFEKILQLANLPTESYWNSSTKDIVEIPLGQVGARDIQYLTLGKGMEHHTLVVGRPGSGKSNFMHIVIVAAALKYTPDEIQFYLIDFKKGVEFKIYADQLLPHTSVVAVESEREFGLSVVEGLDKELISRGENFRKCGANTFSEYRQKNKEGLPRIILMIDEFQEFFVQEDEVSRKSGLILDRLVKQGRAFGIHVILASQALSGSYNLPKSTIDQMAVRVAMQCSDADSRSILAEDNSAARLLSRPGEAIYNTHSGLIEGNQRFQIALFSEKDRCHYLDKITQLAKSSNKKYPQPIIFEGHEPAEITKCVPLQKFLLASSRLDDSKIVQAFLGESFNIKHPTIATPFQRCTGEHLLIVDKEEVAGEGVLISTLVSFLVQHHPKDVKFYILDFGFGEDALWADIIDELSSSSTHQIEILGRRDLKKFFKEMKKGLDERLKEQLSKKRIYIIIKGLHRIRDLRQENQGYDSEQESLLDQFTLILREGPEAGLHVVCWCDTYSNLNRTVDRRLLGEFTMRVAGVMNADASMNLLDDLAASRINKPHRMVFYDEDRPGQLENFRPYALPKIAWIKEITKKLRAKN